MQIIRPFQSLEACFGDIPDRRVVGRCDHILVEIIVVAICGVLSGAESWSEIEEFGEAKEAWLRQYLDCRRGYPRTTHLGGYFACWMRRRFRNDL